MSEGGNAVSGGGAKESAGRLRIMIVDDHVIIREGLKQILVQTFPEADFGQARHAREALDMLRQSHWDVMLLDIGLPGGPDGLDVLSQMREIQPETKTIVLTAHPAEQYAIRVLKLGAKGYLTKDGPTEEVTAAVQRVLAGGVYVAPEFIGNVEGIAGAVGQKPHQLLSNREYQVLVAVAAGKSIKEIGFELSLSIKTVSTYRTRIFEKMNFKSNAEAIRYALKEGLIQ